MPNTQETQGQRYNWYHRYWHDWAQVGETVYEVARAYAQYLGYEIYGFGTWGPPPGNLGPIVRVKLVVARRSENRRPSPHVDLWVDVERRAGNKFHAKSATTEP